MALALRLLVALARVGVCSRNARMALRRERTARADMAGSGKRNSGMCTARRCSTASWINLSPIKATTTGLLAPWITGIIALATAPAENMGGGGALSLIHI